MLAEFTSQNPPPLGAFKTRSHQVPVNILPRTTCPVQNNQTPSPPSSQFQFILSPLFTLFSNTSALPCMPCQISCPPMREAGLSGGQHRCHQLRNVSRKRHASSTVQSRVDRPRAALPLLTSTRLGAALGQMILSTCWRKRSRWRRSSLSISPREPRGRERSVPMPARFCSL